MANNRLAVVTTGGTAEPIDDVRYVTNFSTGKFGHAIAKVLADLGYTVNLLTARSSMWLSDHPGVTKTPFTSAKSLQDLVLQFEEPAIIMMAAAVSDYTTIPIEGKISSNQEELVIRMERTPKILPLLRNRFGPDTFIVGFKLLSGVSREELIRVAQKQLRDNNLDLVVANDLQHLKDGMHPLIVITPEGSIIDFSDTREVVAQQLAKLVHERSILKTFWSS